MPELGPGISGNWSTVVAFPNLAFKNALGLCVVPGTSRLAVWEREGRVWSYENRPDVAEKKLMLDVSNRCQGWDDSGLLGLAFHPDFATNHYVYIWYAWVTPGTVDGDPTHRPRTDKPNHDRLSRFTIDAKYKLYDERRLSTGDIFQNFLYAYAFASNEPDHPPMAVLIYPSTVGSNGVLRLNVRRSGLAVAEVFALGISIPSALVDIRRVEGGPSTRAIVELLTKLH